jgi:hypothetical protein
MGLILKTFNHVGNDVEDVYINLKNVILSNEIEEQEIDAGDGSGDVVMTRLKVWKRVAIFFAYMSHDAALCGLEPIASFKVEFSLDDFIDDGVINVGKLYEQLVAENFSDTEVISKL